MKILILSCSTGGGHNSCARYVEEELKENNISCEFKDFFDIVNVKGKNLSEKLYLSSLGFNGDIFKNVYKLGELYSKTKVTSPVYLVNKLYKKAMAQYVRKNEFDLVVVSHLFPALTLTAINRDKRFNKIPFITIATDYEPCPFLEEAKPDFLIMQKGLEDKFIRKGIDKNVLVNSGIPVSSKFIREAHDIKDELGITKERVVLIMLGSMGFGRVSDIIHELLKEDNIKIIVVCGSNRDLYNELGRIGDDKLIVLGFVHNINSLIYSADIVMTKPGGLSSTEVAVMRKPLLHIFPIPGIETYNANFFNDNGIGIKCDSKDEAIDNCKKLLNDKKKQEEIIRGQKEFINAESAKDLVKLIMENYK